MMKRDVAWFTVLLSTIGLQVWAAPGDYIYRDKAITPAQVTPARAAAYADMFIADAGWDGNRSDITSCQISKAMASGKYFVKCIGFKSVAPANVAAWIAANGDLNVEGVAQ